MEQTPKYLARYMTPELVRQLEVELALIMESSGHGDITIVIKDRQIKWLKTNKTEMVHSPFE